MSVEDPSSWDRAKAPGGLLEFHVINRSRICMLRVQGKERSKYAVSLCVFSAAESLKS